MRPEPGGINLLNPEWTRFFLSPLVHPPHTVVKTKLESKLCSVCVVASLRLYAKSFDHLQLQLAELPHRCTKQF